LAILLLAIAAGCARSPAGDGAAPSGSGAPAATLRLSGTVEAVQARTVSVPRMQGPLVPLLIVDLVTAGTRVELGDTLVEFDPQQQQRNAVDRRAELSNLESDIEKKRAEHAAAEAKDRTELSAADHDVERARLDVRKNDLVPRIDAEKNTLALSQATARFEQLKVTFDLKREAARAELRILEIRRDRAERALRYAQENAALMRIPAPFSGLVVIKRMYRNGAFVEIARGDEVRPGIPVVDIVDTSKMRVRAKLNQADLRLVRTGQRATIGLDGFPDLTFDGDIELITPLASVSDLSGTVRKFVVIVSIAGAHPQLLPDLTAWVDLVPETSPTTAAASRTF
jgi:HlyD family secretion protein